MSNRFFARAAVASLLGLAGMSLGCDKAPSGPTSPAAPTVTAVPPNTGLTVTSVSPAAGLIGEPMRVAGAGFLSGATLTLDGVPAKVIRATSTVILASTPAHALGTVDVVVTNPGGEHGTLTGGYSFVPVEAFSATASPSLVASGGQLTVNWVAPSGRGCNGGGDWVALYKVGDPDDTGAANGHSDLWFVHVCGAASGTSTLSAPPQPGQYEFRYMVDSTPAVARSGPVTVTASASPSVLIPTLSVDGGTSSNRQIDQTFWFTGSGFTAGRTVTRYINPAVNGSTVLTPTLTSDGSGNLTWTFTPSCGSPKNTFAIYAIDDATGRSSNTVTEIVTGSTSCP
jgi:hypothetical protein